MNVKEYVFWQTQRALMCKANYLYCAISPCCRICRVYILCTEVVNRTFFSYTSMGCLLSFFTLRAADDIRAYRPLLYLNGILSPSFVLNALLSSLFCSNELLGLGIVFPNLFKGKKVIKTMEYCRHLFDFMYLAFGFRKQDFLK